MKLPRISLVVLLVAAALIAFVALRLPVAPAQRPFQVAAGDFAFSPAVIRVNPGDQVTLKVTSTDVTHGLSIDGYPVDVMAEPGLTARVSFVADRPGSFKIRCSLSCGNLHPFMTGRLEVGPNLLLFRGVGLAALAFLYGGWRVARG